MLKELEKGVATHALMMAHRKICLNDPRIGDEELKDILNGAMQDILGDNEYCKYADKIENDMYNNEHCQFVGFTDKPLDKTAYKGEI